MQKFKRFMGVALAATMVVGTSMTAFAEDPVTSGGTTGTGTSEGHVDTHVINVQLPTIASGSTPFAYTMDAERLIQETDGAKYSSATFPAAASDTGVYFLTGTSEATTTYTKKATAPDGYAESDFDTLAGTATAEEYAALSTAQQGCYDGAIASYAKKGTMPQEYEDALHDQTEFDALPGTMTTTDYDNESDAALKSCYEPVMSYTKKASAPAGYTDFDSLPTSPTAEEYAALSTAQQGCYESTTTGGGATYANTSEELKATSKSSADVKLTVEVEASSEPTNIKLVDTAPAADAAEAQLYLALKVGDTTTPIKAGEKVSKEVTIQGKDDNFETTVKNGAYVYSEKAVAEGDPALTWNETGISLTGAVSKASAKDLTAPTLTVTWKYEDPAATPPAPADAAPSISQTTYTMAADTAVAINVDLGAGDLAAEGVASIKWGSVDLISRNYASYADSVVTINANCVNILRGKDGSQTIEITFDDDASTVKNVTLNK